MADFVVVVDIEFRIGDDDGSVDTRIDAADNVDGVLSAALLVMNALLRVDFIACGRKNRNIGCFLISSLLLLFSSVVSQLTVELVVSVVASKLVPQEMRPMAILLMIVSI